MSRVSPAACAAVIGKIAKAGVPRSREISNHVFTPGFDAYPQPDNVQVLYLTNDEAERERMLRRATQALAADYTVTQCRGEAIAIGGWQEQDYLEVRSERWGQ